ncbi:glycine cleavage system transcriptional repressor [Thiolapillus brandeum]|uniref:Glycine cleavage system transcriptional repressor n=1 Tax=Thiolapillus brandeum TaxID=1076588 RepID=A0A7U6JHR5_9GAMM|nr:ACT domain-containing protein [Thiolapillus brandeum]BAO43973.1 glycine cleavage system transcriptional repressor [Thiolapillus brandeum]
MSNWYMLTLTGEDRPGIVAQVTRTLFERDMTLGEASMLRLGGNFTIMMMVGGELDVPALEQALDPVTATLGLSLHIDPMDGGLHRHVPPNLMVRVSGADRAGIVARVTGVLAEAGFNILDLASDVAGTVDRPVYIMQIAGVATVPQESLETAVGGLREDGIEVNISPMEMLVG